MTDAETVQKYKDAVKKLRQALDLLRTIDKENRLDFRIDGAEVRIENAIEAYQTVIGAFYAGANQ